MLSLAAPWWLVGLLLLPVIRWLHRGGRHRRSVPVAYLGLWQGAAVSPPAAGERRPPDPAWRRRALLAALLLLALAEPQGPPPQPGLTLWVDTSVSMQTREAQGTRLALALAQARSQLAAASHGDVDVRSLAQPWQSLGPLSDTAVATLTASAGGPEPGPPPLALLRPERLHWLLTDGADARLLAWPDGRRADRVIQVAGVTRNVGLESLSARRRPGEPDRLDLLLKLSNGGGSTETRDVVLTTAAGEVARSSQRLAAGAAVLVRAVVPVAAQVVARLQPADALTEDDQLVLDLSPLRRRPVAIDPTCPAALLAAVRSHPALVVVPSAVGAQAVLNCGAPDAAPAIATISVRADRTPARPAGPLQWSASVAEADRLPLEPAQVLLAARLPVRPADRVLLALGNEPVIVSRAGAVPHIETALDFAAAGLVNQPQIPLLVNVLFETLLGTRLLDALAVADRGLDSSRVLPVDGVGTGAGAGDGVGLGSGSVAREPDRAGAPVAWVRPLLWLAVLVLLWELAALARQWAHLQPHAAMGTK